jgi:virulence factor
METLTFEPKPSTILGIPIEKIHKYRNTIVHLNTRTNFTPVLSNNQLYSQGFFNEIRAFVDTVETGHNRVITDLQTVRTSYEIITEMQKAK